MKKLMFFIVLVIITITGCRSTKTIVPSVHGMIYDGNNEAVSDVEIYINDKKNSTSDIYGHFSLSDLEKDVDYNLKASKEGYEDVYISFSYSNPSQVIYLRIHSVTELLYMAENLVEQRKITEAKDVLNRAEKANGSYLSINYLRAVIDYLNGDYKESLVKAQNLIEAGFAEPYIYLLIADIYKTGFQDIKNEQIYLKKFLDLTYDPIIQERLIP